VISDRGSDAHFEGFEMYTIDEFILRLQDLREIAPLGGRTPVVIERDDGTGFEVAAAELQPVIEILENWDWQTRDSGNDMQVLKVF
jgi:hypothetical protein